jgi:murein DD-endopeptidase MepM/ murein hydrolase activator NlpD
MSVFKGEHWAKGILDKSKNVFSKMQLKNVTTKIQNIQTINHAASWLNKNKFSLLKGIGATIGAVGLFTSIVWSGNHYVKINTNEVFHVYVENQQAGIVSDPEVVEKFILSKIKSLEEEFPNAHMILNTDEVSYESERAFMLESDDETALNNLEGLLTAKAVGVEIRVEGKLIGIVKDKETAESILEQIQGKYIPQKQVKGQVAILSLDDEQSDPGKSQLEEVMFMEQVDVAIIDTHPNSIVEPEEILKKLETGDTKPTKYIVEKGDCINCIAKKFEISVETIYENNNLNEDSTLQIGDELDLTVLKPTLSVKTVERVQELLDVHYETIIEYDDELKVGKNITVKEGVEGKKLATYLITKINGYWEEDELVEEEIVEEPISAIVRKGTMIIRGEGTGSFAKPVIGARISSSYGMRWGRLHAGMDFTSKNRNILAADNGTVTTAGYNSGYGNYVIVDHKNGYRTLYAHLSKMNTRKGQIVEKGEKIGVMGSTGNSTGIHLHFEIHKNGKRVNPSSYIKR